MDRHISGLETAVGAEIFLDEGIQGNEYGEAITMETDQRQQRASRRRDSIHRISKEKKANLNARGNESFVDLGGKEHYEAQILSLRSVIEGKDKEIRALVKKCAKLEESLAAVEEQLAEAERQVIREAAQAKVAKRGADGMTNTISKLSMQLKQSKEDSKRAAALSAKMKTFTEQEQARRIEAQRVSGEEIQLLVNKNEQLLSKLVEQEAEMGLMKTQIEQLTHKNEMIQVSKAAENFEFQQKLIEYQAQMQEALQSTQKTEEKEGPSGSDVQQIKAEYDRKIEALKRNTLIERNQLQMKMENSLTRLNDEVMHSKELRRELGAKSERLELKEMQHHKLMEAEAKHLATIEKLQKTVEEKEMSAVEQKNEFDLLQRENERMKRALAKLKADASVNRAQIQNTGNQDQMLALTRGMEALARSKQELFEGHKQEKKKKKVLEEMLQGMLRQKEFLQLECDQFRVQVHNLEAQKEVLKQQLSVLHDKFMALNSEVVSAKTLQISKTRREELRKVLDQEKKEETSQNNENTSPPIAAHGAKFSEEKQSPKTAQGVLERAIFGWTVQSSIHGSPQSLPSFEAYEELDDSSATIGPYWSVRPAGSDIHDSEGWDLLHTLHIPHTLKVVGNKRTQEGLPSDSHRQLVTKLASVMTVLRQSQLMLVAQCAEVRQSLAEQSSLMLILQKQLDNATKRCQHHQTATHKLVLKYASEVLQKADVSTPEYEADQSCVLRLASCLVDDEMVHSLVGLLCGPDGMEQLDHLEPLAFKAEVAKELKRAAQIKAVGLSNLTGLVLQGNSLSDIGAQALVRLVKESPKLELLDLKQNHIGRSGWIALRSALQQNTTIDKISSHGDGNLLKAFRKDDYVKETYVTQSIDGDLTNRVFTIDLRDNNPDDRSVSVDGFDFDTQKLNTSEQHRHTLTRPTSATLWQMSSRKKPPRSANSNMAQSLRERTVKRSLSSGLLSGKKHTNSNNNIRSAEQLLQASNKTIKNLASKIHYEEDFSPPQGPKIASTNKAEQSSLPKDGLSADVLMEQEIRRIKLSSMRPETAKARLEGASKIQSQNEKERPKRSYTDSVNGPHAAGRRKSSASDQNSEHSGSGTCVEDQIQSGLILKKESSYASLRGSDAYRQLGIYTDTGETNANFLTSGSLGQDGFRDVEPYPTNAPIIEERPSELRNTNMFENGFTPLPSQDQQQLKVSPDQKSFTVSQNYSEKFEEESNDGFDEQGFLFVPKEQPSFETSAASVGTSGSGEVGKLLGERINKLQEWLAQNELYESRPKLTSVPSSSDSISAPTPQESFLDTGINSAGHPLNKPGVMRTPASGVFQVKEAKQDPKTGKLPLYQTPTSDRPRSAANSRKVNLQSHTRPKSATPDQTLSSTANLKSDLFPKVMKSQTQDSTPQLAQTSLHSSISANHLFAAYDMTKSSIFGKRKKGSK